MMNTLQQDDRFRNVRYSPRNGRTSPSHSAHGNLLRHSLMKKTDDLRARKVRFYRNGDRFFKGIVYAVSSERFRTFESLMADLTSSPVCDKNVLPSGVRHIFNAETGRKIRSLHELEEGESYVCASTDVFKDVDYNSPKSNPNWISQNKTPKDVDPILAGLTKTATFEDDYSKHYIKPKLVTIIRNGPKPRKAVRVLLNKKTAHSFDQVLTDITEAIKLDSGAVRKIYTLDGRPVSSLPDFFREEDVFIAYGQERYSQDDFALDDNEVKLVTPYKTTPFRQSERITLKSPKSGRASSRKLTLSNRSLNEDDHAQMAGPPSLSQKYQIGRVIGEGNFAVVSECIDRNFKLMESAIFCFRKTNKLYALKKIEKKSCQGMERMVENEVSIMRKVNHPNIILLVEELDTRDELYLVMEYVKGGDLFDDITMSTKYTEKDASGMIFNLASALKYLHGLKIVHRDVKPENLLIEGLRGEDMNDPWAYDTYRDTGPLGMSKSDTITLRVTKVAQLHSELILTYEGLPLIVVAISAGLLHGEYGNSSVCWISNRLLLMAFVPVVGLVIVANTIVLLIVLRIMVKSINTRASNEDRSSVKSGLKAAVILLPLLGLTWTLGFFSINNKGTLVFTYLFTILNSLQGVFFFVFHCILSVDVQNAYERRSLRKSRSSLASTFNKRKDLINDLSSSVSYTMEARPKY
ncbi:hypothetical protein FSP39_021014 [Pinctada imbricata]|uniref:non-specific serine/threonine protein kinase n=1 Tax=Pinctada imbricata TaxID=66713 RepID=A0AA88Y9Q6_PINIB|nr:hypothetical protein FSP39_021014 [Pinctada imbricata]